MKVKCGNYPDGGSWFLEKTWLCQAKYVDLKFFEHWRSVSSIYSCTSISTQSTSSGKEKNFESWVQRRSKGEHVARGTWFDDSCTIVFSSRYNCFQPFSVSRQEQEWDAFRLPSNNSLIERFDTNLLNLNDYIIKIRKSIGLIAFSDNVKNVVISY